MKTHVQTSNRKLTLQVTAIGYALIVGIAILRILTNLQDWWSSKGARHPQ